MKPFTTIIVAVFFAATCIAVGKTAAANQSADGSPSTHSSETSGAVNPDDPNVDVFIAAGARSMWGAMWGFIPMPPTVGVWVDGGKWRFRTDVGYHPFAHLRYAELGGGIVFTPKGKTASSTGGFQMKIPLLLDVGIMNGSVEAGDGFRDDITWMLVGPGSGLDLIWWKAKRFGFTISFKTAVQFRIDINSRYADDTYTQHKDVIANMDTALLLGIAI